MRTEVAPLGLSFQMGSVWDSTFFHVARQGRCGTEGSWLALVILAVFPTLILRF